MGKLSAVLARFSVTAGVFYSGGLCGLAQFGDPRVEEGHLHVLHRGRLRLSAGGRGDATLSEPTLIFVPRPLEHRLIADASDDAHVVCASVRYGTTANNPLANALPPVVTVPLAAAPRLHAAATWLFEEAFGDDSGRQVMLDRLTEILVVQLLRHCIERGSTDGGMLAGLAHPQLARALMAMHADPARAWSLEELAGLCLMSRSRFAEEFRATVGQPPGDYLIEWRVGVAQSLLRKGKPVGWVANEVGYETASALARVFRKKTRYSPREWLASMATVPPATDQPPAEPDPWPPGAAPV